MSGYGTIALATVVSVAALASSAPNEQTPTTVDPASVGSDRESVTRPAPGTFLVARRNLTDPNFSKTVVLLVGYGIEGALGIVVNRETEQKLSERLKEIKKLRKRDDALYFGGPVSTEELVVMIQTEEPPEGSQPVLEGLHFGAGEELIAELAKGKNKKSRFRVYAGYAGWAPGQLDYEIEAGGWYVAPADVATVFSEAPEGVWGALIEVLEAPPQDLRAAAGTTTEDSARSEGRDQLRGEREQVPIGAPPGDQRDADRAGIVACFGARDTRRERDLR
ncbi:MAG: YqgE/AlgH family protein [Acidobacteriota bacterium]|nr:YqgE/AlgH family protein [Acidobacteriota bacterium]